MKKLFLMIPLLSMIGLMSGCDLFGEKKREYVPVQVNVSQWQPKDTIVYLKYVEEYPATHEGAENSFHPTHIYRFDHIYSYVSYEMSGSATTIVNGGDPVECEISFWIPRKETVGDRPDGSYGDVSAEFAPNEVVDADGKVTLKKWKVWYKTKYN